MLNSPASKYRPRRPIELPDRQWPNRRIEKAPTWCSVDLRDGNQALPIPMTVEEKLEMFDLLVATGFKEIEIGFPSASETEYHFARALIEGNRIPDDVYIQALVQCRPHLIERTFQALRGSRHSIVHFYNSTNPLQRRVTFRMSKEEIRHVAVEGARLCLEHQQRTGLQGVRFQYSPESFSDTEPEFALEVCEAVCDVIQPTVENPLILNLPATVELFTPNLYADQIEWFCRHLQRPESVIISLHTHNDRGTGVAATELGLMAGASRVEGTLFGNGERTGNLDIVTVALNLYTQGVPPNLDFSDLPRIRSAYEKCTRMSVHERHPYAGDLVFTAFSGSHQDAIKKGMDAMEESESNLWEVPYLPIDCKDIGRTYQAIIRINSQSGKGGVAYVMERSFGIEMPKAMHPEFGLLATNIADNGSTELTSLQLREAFQNEYLDRTEPLDLLDYELKHHPGQYHKIEIRAQVRYEGKEYDIHGTGNGPIAAFVDALRQAGWKDFRLVDYAQKAITRGSSAEAVSFIQIETEPESKSFWGASIDTNVEHGSLKALVSAFNRSKPAPPAH